MIISNDAQHGRDNIVEYTVTLCATMNGCNAWDIEKLLSIITRYCTALMMKTRPYRNAVRVSAMMAIYDKNIVYS
jgi:hypothetical protein